MTSYGAKWRRRRRPIIALITCALTAGVYMTWNSISISGHVTLQPSTSTDFRHRHDDLGGALNQQLQQQQLQQPQQKFADLPWLRGWDPPSRQPATESHSHNLDSTESSNNDESSLGIVSEISADKVDHQSRNVANNTPLNISTSITTTDNVDKLLRDYFSLSHGSRSAAQRRNSSRWALEHRATIDNHIYVYEVSDVPQAISRRRIATPPLNSTTPRTVSYERDDDDDDDDDVDAATAGGGGGLVDLNSDSPPGSIVIRNELADTKLHPPKDQLPTFADGTRSPLLGKLRGGPGNCRVYSTRDDLPELVDFAAGVECVELATSPSVTVCPYPNAADAHLSTPLRTHRIWEPHVVRLFQAALLTDPSLGVYDIGANVGQYALLAAAMGRRVVAVEPYRPNIYRLHKAITLGRFQKIMVVENAVSDVREALEVEVAAGDPSGARLSSQDADRYCDEPDCPPHTITILLDDLLEVTIFEAAVMKIDVEGHEHRAFFSADELLTDVHVPYIFMEWVRMREYYGAELDDTRDKRLAQRLVDYLIRRRYTPYGIADPTRRLDAKTWYGWPHDVVWVLEGAVVPAKLTQV